MLEARLAVGEGAARKFARAPCWRGAATAREAPAVASARSHCSRSPVAADGASCAAERRGVGAARPPSQSAPAEPTIPAVGSNHEPACPPECKSASREPLEDTRGSAVRGWGEDEEARVHPGGGVGARARVRERSRADQESGLAEHALHVLLVVVEEGETARAVGEVKLARVLARRRRGGADEPLGEEEAELVVAHVHVVFSPGPAPGPSVARARPALPVLGSTRVACQPAGPAKVQSYDVLSQACPSDRRGCTLRRIGLARAQLRHVRR